VLYKNTLNQKTLRGGFKMQQDIATSDRVELLVNESVRSVYNWMGIGLAITGLVAFYISTNLSMLRIIFGNPLIFFALIIGELALVFSISGMISKIRASTATILFLVYSVLNGITLSFIFLVYTKTSVYNTFFICSATFIACSIYGWTTKRDLTSFGSFFMMGLIGIIIASVVNMFVRSSQLGLMISYIGVFVFVGLTAYDTQRIKELALSCPVDASAGTIRKGAIIGALTLYLDFINLFLMLLRILGQQERQ